jgi:hypothetical protein
MRAEANTGARASSMRKEGSMASLQHDDAVRYLARRSVGRAALLALALAAACGGDRNRAAGRDTTGVAAKADSATLSATDTAAPPAADSTRSAVADTSTKPAATTPAAPAAKAPAAPAVAKRPAPTDTSTKHAAAPAPPKPTAQADTGKAQPPAAPAGRQDTSTATTAAADAPLRDEYHQAPRDTVSQAVYNGWKQFNLNCARCHGEDALGTTIAPHLIVSLKPTGPINTKELFMQVVCAGRPEKGMPAWCALGLEMDKINDIYEYVKGRSDAKISPGRPAVKQQG